MINIDQILKDLRTHYEDAIMALRNDVIAFGKDGTIPPQRNREDGSYAYPQLTLHYSGASASGGEITDRSRAFGRHWVRARLRP